MTQQQDDERSDDQPMSRDEIKAMVLRGRRNWGAEVSVAYLEKREDSK